MKKLGLLLFLAAAVLSAQPQAGIARHVGWGPSLPTACSPQTGDIYFKTTATVGPYFCSATNTWSALTPGGAVGATGATGPGYAPATSATSTTIGTGSKTFTTQAGLAYSAGATVRFSSRADTTNFMEGTVTSYSGTSLVANITNTGGAGTFADWNLNVTGLRGSTGSTGNTGSTGSTGVTGSTGNTGSTGSTGNTGSTGSTGNTGSTGATGATGAPGSAPAAGGPNAVQTGNGAGVLTDSGCTAASGIQTCAGYVTNASTAGFYDFGQGSTPPSQLANSVRLRAPATVASAFSLTLPNADGVGCLQSNGSGTLSIASCGAGTVTFTGSQTATALVTNSSSNVIQTPCATCTLDSSGNLAVASVATAGAGVAGYHDFGAGTNPGSPPASTIRFRAPTSVTAYSAVWPSAQGTGALTNDGSGNLSWAAAGSPTTFQVNGTGLTSSSTVNYQNSSATNGITLTFANPSAGNVQLGISGTLNNAGLTNSSLTVTATSPLTGGGSVALGASTSLGCQTASGSQAGCLSSADWTTFNGKASISSLTTSAIVTGASATTIQTPSATATLDTSGNLSTPGTLTAGAGGSAAGGVEMKAGTALSAPGTSVFQQTVPTSLTAYKIVWPNAQGSGPVINDGSGNLSWLGTTAPAREATFTATCDNATAHQMLDHPTSGASTNTCFGTTTTEGAEDFVDGSTTGGTVHFRLPVGWTGNVDVMLGWFANAASSNAVRWSVATGCVADTEAISTGPSYNTASATNAAYTGTANQRQTTTLTSVATTNCSAGETMYVQVQRIGGDAGDTLTATAELVEMTTRIRITPQI